MAGGLTSGQQSLLRSDALAGDTQPQLNALTSMAVSFNARTHFVETEEELDALVDWDDDGSALRGFRR